MASKLLVYGTGNHLKDMLLWHPELSFLIDRIFDKDMRKVGHNFLGTGIAIESPQLLKSLPVGTAIAVSALRYMEEIREELNQINPGLVCLDIDTAYEKLALSFIRSVATHCRQEIALPVRRQRILVFRLDMLGDVLMTVPLLRELRRTYPDAVLDLVVRAENVDLLRGCPYTSRVIPFDSACVNILEHASRKEFLEEEGLDGHYDVVFLPGPLLTGSACLAELLLAVDCRADCRIGRIYASEDAGCVLRQPLSHKSWLDSMFTRLIWHRESRHEVDCILEVLAAVGVECVDSRMEYWLDQHVCTYAERIWQTYNIPADGTTIAVGLVSREKNKTWDADHFVALWEQLRLANDKLYFVLLGGEDAKESASRFRGMERVINLTGRTTLPEVAACIAKSSFYLGVDTSLLHFASALGKPVIEITIWSASDSSYRLNAPKRVGPHGVYAEICCAGEGYTPAAITAAANVPDFINTVTVDMVYAATMRVLEKIAGDADGKNMLNCTYA